MTRPLQLAVTLLVFLAVGCSSDPDLASPAANEDPSGTDVCEGRADFWISIQQEYLDRLGAATVEDLESGSDQVTAASTWLGSAVLEHIREADSVGCAAKLQRTGPLICDRLDQLRTSGDAGASIVQRYTRECDG